MDAIAHAEAEKYLALGEDELYTLLVPEQARQQVYSKNGLVARGRSLFAARVNEVRGVVCRQYRRRDSSVKNSIDLTVLVGTALLAAPAMHGIPVLPMAALLVKIGLNELCPEEGDGGETHGNEPAEKVG